MQDERLRAEHVPPRAASSASSYYTTLDRFATPTDSVESLASPSFGHDSSVSSAPSSPEPAYDLIHRRREGTALVIQHPTLVNFVPTSDIQTAVRVLPDCVVIDTILPPTATLRASDLVDRQQRYTAQPAEGHVNTNFDAAKLLEEHKREIYQTLTSKLSENYDPTGTIKEEIFTTLTQLTRFPDPKGTNKSQCIPGRCPCICCEMGCSDPLEPHNLASMTSVSAPSTTSPNRALAHTGPVSVPASDSFLEMTEASSDKFIPTWGTRDDGSRSKTRFGLFRLRSFGRSRSQVDLASDKDPAAKRSSVTALPAAAPALPEQMTAEAVPPGSKPTRSRSFSDLVRRRRKKHMAATSVEDVPPLPPTQSSIAQDKAKATRTLDDGPLRFPVRSSSQTNLTSNTRATAGPGRYSLDSARVDTPFEGPRPPPRRSSKLYAIVGRKPVSQLNASLSGGSLEKRVGGGSRNATESMSRNGRSAYGISQILEEDEGPCEELLGNSAGETGSKSRRQSALISDFGLVSSGSLDNDPHKASSRLEGRGGGIAGPAWAVRSLAADRSAGPNIATPETQVGVAM